MLGLAVLVFPLLGAYLVWRELQFGAAYRALARELEAAGELPVDDLPRRPSGRPTGPPRTPLSTYKGSGGGGAARLAGLVPAGHGLRRGR